MRIKRLDLRAFGPFTDRLLDFSSDFPGLHIVYGANEAGKSSCLRALNSLFFGIPVRTDDNFIHPYDNLLIGGRLDDEEGREITFFRRKKRKADIFDEYDNPLDQSFIDPFFSGLEREMFEALYGIDHEALVRGGEDILDQKGDVGQAIFAAGAGLTSLHTILDELEGEADALFRPQATKKLINKELIKFRNLQTMMKQYLLTAREWNEHSKTLGKSEKKLSEIKNTLGEKDRERNRLERLKKSLVHLKERKDLTEKLKEIGEVIVLPSDFREQRRKLEGERSNYVRTIKISETRLKALQERKKGISLKQELLNRAEEIEGLYQRVGEYRKAIADRPQVEGMRISCKTDAAALLKQVRPDLTLDEVETLRKTLSKRKTVLSLGNRYEALLQSNEKTEEDVKKIKMTLDKAKSDLSGLPYFRDPGGLIEAVKLAQKAGDLDQELDEKRGELKITLDSCREDLERLGLWQGTVEEIRRLSIPISETVTRFENEMDFLHQKIGLIKDGKENAQEELNQLFADLKAIQYAGDVPSEEELNTIRSTRDSKWKLIRRKWIDGEDISHETDAVPDDAYLPETYEGMVTDSDETADRLRREAERVQKQASLKSKIEGLQEKLGRIESDTETLESRLTDLKSQWHDAWKPSNINPLSPREMRQWIAGFEQIRLRLKEVEKISEEIQTKDNRRQELRRKLLKEIRERGGSEEFAGEDLTLVLTHAENLLESNSRKQTAREKLESRVDELKDSLKASEKEKTEARKKLDQWHLKWKQALEPFGMEPNAGPAEAADFMDILKSSFDKLDEADGFKKRIIGIDRDNQVFETELADLLKQVAPDLVSKTSVQGVNDLLARLNEARKDDAVWRQYLEEIQALEKEIIGAETSLDSNQKQMAVLIDQAGCKGEEDLDEAETRSSEYLQLKENIAQIEKVINEIAEGVAIEELERQGREVNPDELPGQITALSQEIEQVLDPELNELIETIGREKNEMSKMDGKSRAAEIAEESQQVLAGIKSLTERFIRVKLSTKILLDVIERYREEHQGPILKRASDYFRQISLGSFSALRTDINDQGRPVLIGVRPDGTWLKVDGMSDGTRDQLYLALRLATLDWRLESNEPMPFIVDDIMINFDDDRSRATIKALSGLAERNQIILFTHHRRIVEIAEKMDAGKMVKIHEI